MEVYEWTQICNDLLHEFMDRRLFADAVSLTEVILCIVEWFESMITFGELSKDWEGKGLSLMWRYNLGFHLKELRKSTSNRY
jgi:hypothetical protein